MKFAPTQSPSKNRGDDNLIPLINVVFLMLIFFMIAGQISRTDAARIVPPASISDQHAADDNRTLVLISAREGRFVDDQPVSLEAIGDTLARRRETSGQPDGFSVLVKADAETPVEELQAVLRQIRAAGLMKVSLATRLQGGST